MKAIYDNLGVLIPDAATKVQPELAKPEVELEEPPVPPDPQVVEPRVPTLSPRSSGQGVDVMSVGDKSRKAPESVPWDLTMIGAPEAWQRGATGKGLVFGSVDTGVDGTHEAVHASYRGTNPDGTVDNQYNWIDFEMQSKPAPYDPWGHGTHTLGTVVGQTPDGKFGVAPEAKWIAAHALTGLTPDIFKALQWMQAPTRQDGTAPDPSKAPDVIGISWYNGKAYQDLYKEVITNFEMAGIEVVKSAGNKGPMPETISSPGQFENVAAVAAVDRNGEIPGFSSRGPTPIPHPAMRAEFKPDFAAPGVDIISSVPGNQYQMMSGTSMAQPHVVGAMLAILSKYPNLGHNQLWWALTQGATDAGAKGQDFEYGRGIINIPKALDAASRMLPAPTTASTAKSGESAK